MQNHEVMSLVRDNIRHLAAYSTARDEYKGDIGIFLDANENPFDNGYNRYPDPRQQELKRRVSLIKAIPTEQIFLGNGSDEAIDLCFRVFCHPGKDNVVSIAPTYGMYKVAAAINDVAVREVALGADFSLPVAKMLKAADEHTKLLLLCSPNNPTGNSFPLQQVRQLLDGFHGIVVVDEAYIDFSSQPSLLTLLKEYDRLVVLQTFSKAYGLAALRLGMAFAHETIIDLFSKVKYPYNINLAGMELATELLQRDVQREMATIVEERGRMAKALPLLSCVKRVYPSDANFLLVRVTDADAIYQALIAQQIIVRNRTQVKGCEGCLRITIGTPEENDRLLQVMATL